MPTQNTEKQILPLGTPLDVESALRMFMSPNAKARHTVSEKIEKYETIGSFTYEDIPQLAAEATTSTNRYMSVNAFPPSKDPKYPFRKTKYISYFNACYTDLDAYKLGLDEIDAFAIYLRMIKAGKVPSASLIAMSGRGLYLLWLIREENDPNSSIRFHPDNNPETLELYKQTQNRIYQTFAKVGSDSNAIDASRVLRIAGTIHKEATAQNGNIPVQCQYFAPLNQSGQTYQYTLPELARLFGVKTAVNSQAALFGRQTINIGSAPKRINGQRGLGEKRVDDIETMDRVYQGFLEGKRCRSLQAYTKAIRAAGIKFNEALPKVEGMAKRCRPSYPSHPNDQKVKDIVASIYESKTIPKDSNQRLVELFEITEEIAERENLQTIVPESIRKKRERVSQRTKETATKRRAFVKKHVSTTPLEKLSLRAVAEAATAKGFKCDHKMAQRDLKALNISWEAWGKPSKELSLF